MFPHSFSTRSVLHSANISRVNSACSRHSVCLHELWLPHQSPKTCTSDQVTSNCRLLAGLSSSHLMLHWAVVDPSVYQHSLPAAAATATTPPVSTAHSTDCDWNEYDCIIGNLLLRLPSSPPPPPQTWYKSNRIQIYLLSLRHLAENNLLCCATDTANPLLFT